MDEGERGKKGIELDKENLIGKAEKAVNREMGTVSGAEEVEMAENVTTW